MQRVPCMHTWRTQAQHATAGHPCKPAAHLKAGSLPTTHRPSRMGTLATLTSEKPEAPSARLKVPVCVVCRGASM